jgi:hypothetical protein
MDQDELAPLEDANAGQNIGGLLLSLIKSSGFLRVMTAPVSLQVFLLAPEIDIYS